MKLPKKSPPPNRLQFFKSFEEMEAADAIKMAKFTPVEHLQHVTEYLKHVYADELKNKMTDLKIKYK